MTKTRLISAAVLAGLSLVPEVPVSAQGPAFSAGGSVQEAPPPDVVLPPRGRRRLHISIPPIGRFGGFSADIGRGDVNVNVGPSGGGFGGPAFGGVNVSVFRPQPIYGPAVVYGPGVAEFEPTVQRHVIVTIPNPFLGCVGADGQIVPGQVLSGPVEYDSPDLGNPQSQPDEGPDLGLPDAAPTRVPQRSRPDRGLDSLLPEAPPTSLAPKSAEKSNEESPEIPVPKRSKGDGPVLPELPPQSSNVAPRLFPTRGPRLLPAGFVPNNGFEVDRETRPNAPVRPGDDPFGPTRPQDPNLPAT